MNSRNDSPAHSGLPGWWLAPPRHGLQRFIVPWEYRRLHLLGIVRLAGGSLAAVAGFICLSYRAYGWASFFLAIGALALAAGCWFLGIDRSSARTL